MAEFCCICNAKIGMLSEYGILQTENPQHRKLLCSECKNRRAALNNPTNEIGAEETRSSAVEYFEKYLQVDTLDKDVKDCIDKWIALGREKAEKQRIAEEQDALIAQETNDRIEKLEANREHYERFVTTSYQFEGYKIINYLGTVSGEVVMGTGFLSEFCAGVSDFFGITSDVFADKMAQAKKAAEARMIKSSVIKGGNAIIGVTFSYTTFSNNMVAVSVNGTSVVIREVEN